MTIRTALQAAAAGAVLIAAQIAAMPAAQRKPLLMDEFNSASCGGVPESNMFGTTFWAADYALQMARVG